MTSKRQFVPSLDAIQKNHPYLGGLTLAKHAENGTLYVVDLTEVDIDENEINMKSDDKQLDPMALFVVSNKMLMPVAIKINARITTGMVFKPSTLGKASDVRGWVKV